MPLKCHLEVEFSPGNLKSFRKLAWREGGASAPHIQRYLPIVMVQNQRCCTKWTPTEAKIFRDFHSQMQFSLNKLHFPDEKSANFSPHLRRRLNFSQAARLRRADPTFGSLRTPKVGAPSPTGKNLGDDTEKSPRTGFSQWLLQSLRRKMVVRNQGDNLGFGII